MDGNIVLSGPQLIALAGVAVSVITFLYKRLADANVIMLKQKDEALASCELRHHEELQRIVAEADKRTAFVEGDRNFFRDQVQKMQDVQGKTLEVLKDDMAATRVLLQRALDSLPSGRAKS